MPRYKIGDTVRFLNDVGGGKVTKVQPDRGVVFVRDDSGFEIPYPEHDLVLVSDGSTIVPTPEKHQSISDALNTGVTRHSAAPTRIEEPVLEERRERGSDAEHEVINAYLCYLPAEPELLGNCPFEVYLVNDSNYDLQVLYVSGDDDTREFRYQGVVPFDSVERLEAFPPSALPHRLHTTLYITPFKIGTTYLPKPHARIDLRVEGSRFFKPNAYRENDFLDDRAIIFEVIKEGVPFSRKPVADAGELEALMNSKKQTSDPRPRRQESRTPSAHEPMVVDLHIDKLVDNTLGMSNRDMLDLQLSEVDKVMRQHAKPKDKGREIIFIHGKGEGVLRKAVIDMLHHRYPKCDLRDASFREYGYGATKVTIR